MAAQLPSPLAPIVDSQGRSTKEFYDWLQLKDRLRLADMRDVDATGVTDGQQLTWVDADGKWKPGAA